LFYLEYTRKKKETPYENKATEGGVNSFQVWIQADPTSLALSHICWKNGKFAYTCPQEGRIG